MLMASQTRSITLQKYRQLMVRDFVSEDTIICGRWCQKHRTFASSSCMCACVYLSIRDVISVISCICIDGFCLC